MAGPEDGCPAAGRVGDDPRRPRDRDVDGDRRAARDGPDLLGPDWDPGQARTNLLADRDRPVGEALLDQRVLAGIGAFYLAETCFLRGVTPWTPVGEVTDPDRLLDLAHRLIVANANRAVQVTTGDARRGRTP